MEYEAEEFDKKLRTPGLHKVRKKVEHKTRKTILPPDLFSKFSQLSFWENSNNSLANVVSVQSNLK